MEPPSSGAAAWVENRQRRVRFHQKNYTSFVQQLGREVAHGREFAVVITCDAAVRRANLRFRGKNASTDVLSFPDGDDGRLGDILIAAGKAEQQARRYGHSTGAELKVLTLHGLLHLLGYDHEIDNGRMRRAENRLRRKYGLTAGLIERVRS